MTTLHRLFAAVYTTPESDEARLVLADALQEAGDTRGEFITLQVDEAKGRGTARTKARAQALLERHWRSWLAEVPGVQREELVFHRGFLRSCSLRPCGKGGDSAVWRTVERIQVRGSATCDELGAATMTSLEAISGVDEAALDALVSGADKPRLREVETLGPALEGPLAPRQRRLVLGLERFRALETLRLSPTPFRYHAAHLAWLYESALIKRLRLLVLRVELPVDLGGIQALVERLRLRRLVVRCEHRGTALVLEHGLLRIEAPSAAELEPLAAKIRNLLAQFVPDPFRELSVRIAGKAPSAAQLSALGDLAVRHAR